MQLKSLTTFARTAFGVRLTSCYAATSEQFAVQVMNQEAR